MQPISLIFKPSYLLALLFVVVAIGAVIIVLMLPVLLWLKLILSVIVFLHASYVILRFTLLKLPNSIIKLEVNSKGELSLYDLKGLKYEAQLQLSSFVSPYLTTLSLQAHNRTTGLLITPLNADINGFRQLRVWLKWHKFN